MGRRTLAVSTDLIVRIGRGAYRVDRNEFPADTKVVDLYVASEHLILFTLESAEWEDLGSVAPMLESPWIQILPLAETLENDKLPASFQVFSMAERIARKIDRESISES